MEDYHGWKQMTERRTESTQKKAVSSLFRVIVPMLVLACGVLLLLWLVQTSPKAKTGKKRPSGALVEVLPLEAVTKKITVTGMGLVQPAQAVDLKARVSGEVIDMDEKVIPGGYVQKGELLFQLDPTDYKISARQLASQVKKAESDLEIERGNQLVAQKEFELLGESVRPEEKNLILRKPQMKILTAALEDAKSRLEKAELDISRTSVRAPFNGVVQNRMVNIGSQVGSNTPLAHLVGTDEFWVNVTLPVKKLSWLHIPQEEGDKGSKAIISNASAWGEGIEHQGRVLKLTANLEEKGRMARVIVGVKDPLLLVQTKGERFPLLLGSFVQVTFEGKELSDVVVIERRYLHDGNTVWLMDSENKLRIRKVDILYKDHNQVFVSGVEPGEKMVISNLALVVEGLPLRLKKKSQTGPPKSGGAKKPGKGVNHG